MICPICDGNNNVVLDSRFNKKFNQIRRRRRCLDCDSRFTTYESLAYERGEIINFLNQTRSHINKTLDGKIKQIQSSKLTTFNTGRDINV